MLYLCACVYMYSCYNCVCIYMLICTPLASVVLEFLISIINKKLKHIAWIDLDLQRKTVSSSS